MRAHADKRQEHRHNLLIVYVILAIPGLSYTTASAMTTLKSNNSKITPVRYIYIPKRSEKHQIRVICTLLCGRSCRCKSTGAAAFERSSFYTSCTVRHSSMICPMIATTPTARTSTTAAAFWTRATSSTALQLGNFH